jgi:hypothetical protein
MVEGTDSGESTTETVRVDSDASLLFRIAVMIRRSILLFSIFAGFLMLASSVVIDAVFANQGVLAAMFVIWGASAIFFGALGWVAVVALGLR